MASPSGGAVGRDANVLEGRLLDALADLQAAHRTGALAELYVAFGTAGSAGWDGEDGQPVSTATYVTARDFLRALPTAYPSPEVAALEDGSIAFDWFPAADANFSVVVYPDARVVFASVTPDGSSKGIYRFEGQVPERIVDELRRLF